MNYLILKKERFNDFISALAKSNKVMAPVEKGYNNYAFEQVTKGDEISLNYIPTILPPKKFFFPQREKLLEYDRSQGESMKAVVEYEEMVIFGVHTCDLAGIQALNIVFSDRPKDQNYLMRKNKIGIIGLECNNYCDEHASCKLVDNELPNGGYDLFFTDLGNYFYVHVNTLMGDEIVDKTGVFEKVTLENRKEFDDLRMAKRKIFINEVDTDYKELPDLFEKGVRSKVWDDLGKRCLACGNCTNVCPTCYCFDVLDELNLDLTTGERTRMWDSCQNETFAKVAGNENFREERSARQRHRFYRKFKYPMHRYARPFCTGCGRCSRTCMAKIDLKDTLKQLIEENA